MGAGAAKLARPRAGAGFAVEYAGCERVAAAAWLQSLRQGVCDPVVVMDCADRAHRFSDNKIDGVALLKLDADALFELGVVVCQRRLLLAQVICLGTDRRRPHQDSVSHQNYQAQARGDLAVVIGRCFDTVTGPASQRLLCQPLSAGLAFILCSSLFSHTILICSENLCVQCVTIDTSSTFV